MRGRGAYLVLYGECVAYPELRPTYSPWTGELSVLRDAVVEQCRRALNLCRKCHVPEPAHADWPA